MLKGNLIKTRLTASAQGTYKELLEKIAQENGWEKPMYNSMPYEEVGKGVKYIGKVEINGHSYVSNPIFNTTNEAEEAAAKNAYNELKDLQKFGPPIDLNDQQAIDNLFDKIIQVKSAFITIKLLEIHFAMSLLKIYNNFKL